MRKWLAWLKSTWRLLNPGPTDPILWHCKPLLVLDGTGKAVFHAHEIDVEFKPDGRTGQSGVARIIDCAEKLPVPELAVSKMTIRDVRDRYPSPGGGREGVILHGRYHGKVYDWFTDGEADDMAYLAAHGPATAGGPGAEA